jgi:hypothetical protein
VFSIFPVGYVIAALGVIGNGVFFVDINELGDRLAIVMTNFLALCAFQSSVDGILPNISYLSVFQVYMISMNLVCISQGVEITISAALEWTDDVIFFYVNTLLWLVIQLGFFLYVRYVVMPKEQQKVHELTPHEQLLLDGAIDVGSRGMTFHKFEREPTNDSTGTVSVYKRTPKKAIKYTQVQLEHAEANAQKQQQRRERQLSVRERADSKLYDKYGGSLSGTAHAVHAELFMAHGKMQSQCPKNGSSGHSWWQADDQSTTAQPMGATGWSEFKTTVWDNVFAAIDEDGNGFLDAAEIQKVAKAAEFPELSQMASEADTDGDAKVSAGEWAELLVKVHKDHGEFTPKTRAVLDKIASSAKKQCPSQQCPSQQAPPTACHKPTPLELAIREE